MATDPTPLIETEDVTGLMRLVDGLCETREWDDLLGLARLCRAAVERGRQLWPVAMHVDYRLALEGPAPLAAGVLESTAGRFTLGPLTEVAACAHDWASLAPHLPGPHVAAAVAQERVLRGEDLTGDTRAAAHVFEIPLRLLPGEDACPLPVYRSHDAEFPDPSAPPDTETAAVRAGAPAAGPGAAVERALHALTEAWTSESEGACHVTVVAGDALAAIGALAGDADVRLAPLALGGALARMTWAAASGGARGRRRGGASGRFHAWWAAAEVARADLPPAPEADDTVRWLWWEPLPRPTGWLSCLAAEHPDGWATAVLGRDTGETATGDPVAP